MGLWAEKGGKGVKGGVVVVLVERQERAVEGDRCLLSSTAAEGAKDWPRPHIAGATGIRS
jgi:hypothetical protein